MKEFIGKIKVFKSIDNIFFKDCGCSLVVKRLPGIPKAQGLIPSPTLIQNGLSFLGPLSPFALSVLSEGHVRR